MTTTLLEAKPEILERAAELQSQVAVIQEKLQTLLRGAGGLQVVLPELHDESSGRIDAQKLAVYLGVPLKRLAEGLHLNYKAIHRNPSAEAFQPALRPVKRSAEILHDFFHKPETVRVWLNTSHPDLDGHTALETILANKVSAVLRILENAAAGVPV
jgi:pterin-4a-carbinolamine dehydratase